MKTSLSNNLIPWNNLPYLFICFYSLLVYFLCACSHIVVISSIRGGDKTWLVLTRLTPVAFEICAQGDTVP